jgi:hypothetical protein
MSKAIEQYFRQQQVRGTVAATGEPVTGAIEALAELERLGSEVRVTLAAAEPLAVVSGKHNLED